MAGFLPFLAGFSSSDSDSLDDSEEPARLLASLTTRSTQTARRSERASSSLATRWRSAGFLGGLPAAATRRFRMALASWRLRSVCGLPEPTCELRKRDICAANLAANCRLQRSWPRAPFLLATSLGPPPFLFPLPFPLPLRRPPLRRPSSLSRISICVLSLSRDTAVIARDCDIVKCSPSIFCSSSSLSGLRTAANSSHCASTYGLRGNASSSILGVKGRRLNLTGVMSCSIRHGSSLGWARMSMYSSWLSLSLGGMGLRK